MRVVEVTLFWAGPAAAAGFYAEAHIPGIPPFLFWVFLGLGVLAAFLATLETLIRGGAGRMVAQQALGTLLPDLAARVWRHGGPEAGLRYNVMRLHRGCLRMVVGTEGVSLLERGLGWQAGPDRWQGACGLAVLRRQPVMLDLSEWKTRPYGDLRHEDGQPRWGLTEEHWARTRDLGSVVSMPLIHGQRVVGVLNVDARLGLREWLPEERQDDFLDRLHSVSGALALLLTI